MRVLAGDWCSVAIGLGIVAGAALASPAAAAHTKLGQGHASTTVHAASHAKAGPVRATLPAHLAGQHAFAPLLQTVHLKGMSWSGAHSLLLHGASLSLHDGVYYHPTSKFAFSKGGKARFAMHGRGARYAYAPGGAYGDSYAYGGSLQCVPFARAASGIELKGNAANWWEAAAGVYERGSRPEPGSVLNFRATGHMRLGHVAVVAAVIDGREIEVDHANWAGAGAFKGGVARGVHVVDVSPDNDWSEVRVALGGGGDYGSTYPTYGFIYDRPDSGMMVAEARRSALRGISEVAEAPRR